MDDDKKTKERLIKELRDLRKQKAEEGTDRVSKLELAEKVRWESEERVRTIIEESQIAIYETDALGNLLHANKRWSEIAGMTSEEARGQGWMRGLHPDDRERVFRLWEKHTTDIKPWSCECRFLTPEGRETWVFASSVTLRDEQGEITGFIGTNLDITDRKLAEEALRESEARIHAILKVMPDLIFRVNRDGVFLDYSGTKESVLYATPETFLGKKMSDVLPAGLAEQTMANVLRTLETEEPQRFEYQLPIQGDIRDFEARMVVSGKNEVMFIVRDITERTQAEVVLRESEERYRNLFESILDGVAIHEIVLDDEGVPVDYRFLLLNPAFEKITGLSAKDIQGKMVREVLPKIEPVWIETYGRVALTGETTHFEERSISLNQIFRVTAYRNAPRQFVTVFEDITVRTQAEEALRESEERYRVFINSTDDMAFLKDDQFRYLLVNRTNASFFGKDEAEIIGKTDFDLMPEKIARRCRESDEKVFGSDDVVIEEERVGERIYETHKFKVPLNDKSFGIGGYIKDITERTRAVEALRNEREFSHALLENISDGVIACDAEGAVTLFNRTAREWHGCDALDVPPEKAVETLGLYYADGETPIPAERMPLIRAFRGEEVHDEETVIIADGLPLRNVIVSGKPFFDDQGNKLGAVLVMHDITERKRTEEEMHETERRLADIINFLPDATFAIDREGRVIAWNRAIEEMTGISEKEMLGEGNYEYAIPFYGKRRPILIDLLQEKDAEELNRYTAVRRVGDTLTGETEWANPGGKDVYLSGKAILFKNIRGEVVGAIESIRDITELKRAERISAESSRLLNSVLESNPEVIVFALDSRYRYLVYNNKHREVMQNIWGKEITVGMNMLDEVIGCDIDREKARKNFDRALGGETFIEIEEYGDEKLARLYWEDRYSPVYSEDGTIVGLTCFVLNISERRRMENALRESEEKYRLLIDTANESIIVAQDYLIKFVNPMAIELFGEQSDHELIDTPFAEVIHPDDRDMVIENYTRRIAKETLDHRYAFRVMTRDGVVKWVELNSAFIKWQGKPATVNFLTDITERRRIENSLRESEEKYRMLVENSHDIIYMLDMEGVFTFVSQSWTSLLGHPVSEVVGKPFQPFVHPDDVPVCMDFMRETVETGQRQTGAEYRVRHADGTWRWHTSSGVPLWDEAGRAIGVEGSARDITERKQAEEEARRANDVINSSPVVAFLWRNDENWPVEYVSENCERVLGCSREGLISGRISYVSLIHPDDLARVVDEVRTYSKELERTSFHHMPYRLIKPDGNILWVDDLTTIRRDAEGRTTHYQGVVLDITERKLAAEEILKREELYRTILMTTKDGFTVFDNTGRFLDVNDRLCEILGYTRGELRAMNLIDIGAEPNQESFEEHKAMIRENRFIRFEVLHTFRDGKKIDIEVSVSYVSQNDTFLAFFRDITEKKKLEEQFRQSQKMESVGRLAGGVAHDFNNILTAIIGHAELLLMSISPEDLLYVDIMEIRKSAERAANLTRQLLAFSRKQIVSPKIVNLNEMILDMERMLRRIIGEHIEYMTLPTEDLRSVSIDPGQIEQVLTNLVVNARDAMPKGGKLIIETANTTLDEEYANTHPETSPGEYMMLSVSDTGIGMDRAVMAHLFEPFFTTKPRGGGTGLGLSTCYGIVKQNRGTISVYSEPGYGTTVKVYLPVVMDAYAALPEKMDFSPTMSLGNETILVVEDEPVVRSMIIRTLEQKGYALLSAGNGKEALSLLAKHTGTVDALVTDVVMPVMGGKELSRRILAFQPDIRILFMSGYTDNTIAHHGVLEKGIEFIQKPFSPMDLVRKVRELLDR